jgi:hypothetical protein
VQQGGSRRTSVIQRRRRPLPYVSQIASSTVARRRAEAPGIQDESRAAQQRVVASSPRSQEEAAARVDTAAAEAIAVCKPNCFGHGRTEKGRCKFHQESRMKGEQRSNETCGGVRRPKER